MVYQGEDVGRGTNRSAIEYRLPGDARRRSKTAFLSSRIFSSFLFDASCAGPGSCVPQARLPVVLLAARGSAAEGRAISTQESASTSAPLPRARVWEGMFSRSWAVPICRAAGRTCLHVRTHYSRGVRVVEGGPKCTY